MTDPTDHLRLMEICIEDLQDPNSDDGILDNLAEYLVSYYGDPSPELIKSLAEFWLKPIHHFQKWTSYQIFAFSLSSLNCEKVVEELKKPKNDNE